MANSSLFDYPRAVRNAETYAYYDLVAMLADCCWKPNPNIIGAGYRIYDESLLH